MNHKEDGYRKDNPQRSACRASRMSFWYERNSLESLVSMNTCAKSNPYFQVPSWSLQDGNKSINH